MRTLDSCRSYILVDECKTFLKETIDIFEVGMNNHRPYERFPIPSYYCVIVGIDPGD